MMMGAGVMGDGGKGGWVHMAKHQEGTQMRGANLNSSNFLLIFFSMHPSLIVLFLNLSVAKK